MKSLGAKFQYTIYRALYKVLSKGDSFCDFKRINDLLMH